jgi:hypothetical protein
MPMPSMSNSSAASSGTGDQSNSAAFNGGNVNFGTASGIAASGTPNLLVVGLFVIGAIWLFKRKK